MHTHWKTNENIINIIQKNMPSSIIRIGGSDYECFISGKLDPIMYELNGYFDKSILEEEEINNFTKFHDLYIDSIKNCDMTTVCTHSTIKKFGFIPSELDFFSMREFNFLNEHVAKNIPICHWDFMNLDYERNFFLNVFPHLNNKKICIISCFTDDIEEQLEKKDKLFINECSNNRVGNVYNNFTYPIFSSIEYIKVPICYCEYKFKKHMNTKHNNSLELFEYLKNEILNTHADIYLIGAGIYANLLCNFVKEKGKIGINCGSAIQLFFGLLGNRFEYLREHKIVNEHWKYPDMKKCVIYSHYAGGFEMDGLQAYKKKD